MRTSVRLSLQFSFLYAVLSGLVFAMAYGFTQYEVRNWVLDQMQGDAMTLQAIYDDGGAGKLVDRIEALAAVSFENARVYQLQDADGTILSGNIAQTMPSPLFATIPASGISLTSPIHDEVERYWMQETTIGPYRLILGSGDHIVAEIMEALGAALVLGYLAVIGLGLLVGVHVGRITEARITAVLTTLSQVSCGKLAARVPVSGGSHDDLSRVSLQINAMLDQITQLLESQQQISSDIAHDMRTPLQHLYQRLERMSEAEVILLEDVLASLSQTQEIIATFNAMLRIAQLEAGERQTRFGNTNLARILSNVAEVYEPAAEDQRISLKLALPAERLEVRGDRELLTQLFANIVENAVRHCPSGTTVDVTAEVGLRHIIVRVTDDGPGIQANDRERIFRRFFRGDRSRHSPGNGLGLALVKVIADVHRAVVSVHDNDPGSVFEVRLIRSDVGGEAP